MRFGHRIFFYVYRIMSDSDDDSVQRPKKQLSEAKLAAIEKMKEGRRRSLEAKKKQREEEKEAKKKLKKQIKLRVEEELNGITSLPTDDKEFMEDLRKKAVSAPAEVKIDESKNEVKDIVGEVLEEQPFSSPTEPHSVVKDEDEGDESPPPKPKRKPRKKKKVVVNNYYEDSESEEEIEEVVNNYHSKKKKKASKPRPIVKEEEEELEDDSYIYDVPEPEPQLIRQSSYRANAMAGIVFR